MRLPQADAVVLLTDYPQPNCQEYLAQEKSNNPLTFKRFQHLFNFVYPLKILLAFTVVSLVFINTSLLPPWIITFHYPARYFLLPALLDHNRNIGIVVFLCSLLFAFRPIGICKI